MFKAFKYRIYPTDEQKVLIEKHIGACRFVYNLALETRKAAYSGYGVYLSQYDLTAQLAELKKECDWLREVNAQSLQGSIKSMDAAHQMFFKGYAGFPRFKKKTSAGSFHCPQSVYIKKGKLRIPKFKDGLEMVISRPHIGSIKTTTISKTNTGKYFASILCETGEQLPSKAPVDANSTIGVDLGIKTFAVTSKREEIESPKFLRKSESKLKYVQRKYSKRKGVRTKKRLSLLYEKVANQRKDFLQKTSSQLIRDNQSIAIEDLNIEGMLQNHKLAKSISDAGWGGLVFMLKYKADWYGKNILTIGRFEPSSKTCSSCGISNKELKLSDREWTCVCGVTHDRDFNAAKNIKAFALKNLSEGIRLKSRNELPALVGVLTSEVKRKPRFTTQGLHKYA